MCLSKGTDTIAIIVYNSELMTFLSVVIIVVAIIVIVMQYAYANFWIQVPNSEEHLSFVEGGTTPAAKNCQCIEFQS